MREEITAASWAIYEQASAHINAEALSSAEYQKREATIPAIFRIGNRVFVTTGAWWSGDDVREISIAEVHEAQPHEQDDRTPGRPPDRFYHGRVFKCDQRRWLIIGSCTLLPPTEPRPQRLEQESLF